MLFLLENTYEAYVIIIGNLKLEKAFVYKLVPVLRKTLAIKIQVH